VKFVSEKGEKPREKPEPKPKPIPFRCEYCGKERHLAEFCYRRKRDERLAREQANQDRYRQPHGIPEPRVPLPRGVGSVKSVGRFPQRGGGERFDRRDDGVHGGERFGRARGGFDGRPPTRPQYGFKGDGRSFGFQRNYEPRFPLVVLVLLPWDMGSLVAREWCLLTPLLSRWLDTGLTFFVLTPVSSR
jgi:hypothetical protein